MGAKALSRGLSMTERAKAIGKGIAGEMASEQVSASIDDPRLSMAERLQVAKDSIIAAAGLTAAGATPGAIARTVERFSQSPNASVNDRTAPMPPADQTVPDAVGGAGSTPAAGSSVSPLPGIAQRAGTVDVPPLVPGLEAEDIGPLTSADVQDMEEVSSSMFQVSTRQPILAGVPDRVAPFRDRPLNVEPQMSGDVITDLRIPRSPEAIAESQRIEQERQQQVAEMRMLDAKARGMPLIPDSPMGSMDILDWANENPIYLPPGFSEERKLPEYESLKRNPLPNYWRQFVASGKQGGNPDSVAQRAYDAGLIAEPTADAYFAAVQEGIAARKQYRVQFQQRDKALAQEEKRVVDFEKSQTKLAKKPDTQEVPFEDIVPGDRMTIDGENAVVKNVEYNEDGYLTNVVIEDGKRFGLMQFDPQNRGGILVDEFKPQPRQAVEDFAPAEGVGQLMSEAPTRTTTTAAATPPAAAPAATPGRGEVGSGGAGGAALLDVAPSTRPRNRGETAKPQREDVLAELGQATREGAANQAQGTLGFQNLDTSGRTAGFLNAEILAEAEALVRRGVRDFAAWSRAMIARFGEGIRTYLAGVWDNVRRNSQLGAVMNPFARGPLLAPASDMASTSGAAQNAEPSPGGLSEAEEFLYRLADFNLSQYEDEAKQLALKTVSEKAPKSWTQNQANKAVGYLVDLAMERKTSEPEYVRKWANKWIPYYGNHAGDFERFGVNKRESFFAANNAGFQRARTGSIYISFKGQDLARIGDHSPSEDRDTAKFHIFKRRVNGNELSIEETVRQFLADKSRRLNNDEAAKVSQGGFQKQESSEASAFGGNVAGINAAKSTTSVNPESSRAAGGAGFTNLDTSGRTAGFLNTEILAEATDLLRQGITDFTNWSRAMLTRFGRGIRDYLQGIWAQITSPQTNAAQNVRLGLPQGTAPVSVGAGGFVGTGNAPAANETQARFASPDEAQRVINGPRADVDVAAEATAWLDSLSSEAAVDAFASRAVPLPLDAAEFAAATLISRLTMQGEQAKTEAGKLAAHVQAQRMARVWTKEYLSADPARALRQRGVVNNTILRPIAPVMAAQGILVDRADAVMNKRFEGGAGGVVQQVQQIDQKASTAASEELAAQLDGEPDAPELGDNPEVSPVSDARVAELEQQMQALREQMVREQTQADTTIAQTSSTWQKILAVMQGASSRKSAILTGAKGKLAAMRKAAQARKAARRKEGRLNANPVEDFADDAIIGASFLAEGIVEFTNWSQAVLREIGFRSGQDLRKLYAEASKQYLAALEAEKAAPTKARGTPKQRAAREKINRAQRTAQNILDSLARRYSDPPIFDEGQRKVNAMRELYKERVRTGMAEAEFVQRAKALGANEGTAGILWEASKLEIDAREMMALEKSRAGLAAYLQKDSPALAKLLDALRKKIAPGMSWADIFMDMPSSQRERQREIYRRLMLDERLKDLTMEQRLDLTNELDRAWQRERKAVFNRELEKAGILGEKDKGDRDKVKKALPKLLRMINLGMFNSEMWREIVAPEYGLKMLTAADTAQLRAMAEAAWKLPEGVIRNQKLRDLLNAIQKKTGASWVEVLNSYWTAAVLSGLRTQFDTWLAAVNGMGTNLMQIGGLIARGQGRAAIDAHAQWWRGLFEGVRESGQILFKGDTSYLKRFGADLKKALEGETSVTPVPLGENLWRNGNTFQKYGLAPVMMFTGRLMAAADHINNTATTQGAIAVARALHPELYQDKVGFTAAERANARAQALREVTGGREPQTSEERATVSARAREILNGSLQAEDYAAASEIGDMAAYQNDPTGIFGIVYSAMKQGLGTIQRGLNDYAQDVTANRFARVAAGVMAGSLHGVTGTRFMRFGANFGADMTRYIPGSYVLGKAGFYGREVSQAQQELLLGKNLVGLMLMSTLAAVFLNSDDEDEGWQIEGDWSTLNPQQVKERMAAGLERMTLWKRENGQVRRVSYKQWPTMGLFSVVGGMLDEKRHKPAQFAQHGTAGHLLRGIATGYTQIKNVSAVRNLVELFGEPTFSADAVDGTIDKMIKTSTNFAGGFVPTLVKDADIWTDPRSFKPEGVAEMMMRNTPILRKYVNDGRPQLNLLGEEVKLQRAPWSRAYTNVQSAEAHRVLGALLARGLALPMPSDEVKLYQNGVKVPLETLGREAVWQYERAVGQGYKDWLSTDGAALLTLPVDQAEKAIQRRAETIKRQALGRVQR